MRKPRTTADWIGLLTIYRRAHGHGNPPYDYVTPGGVQLGQWVVRARRAHRAGIMPQATAVKLYSLGLDLDPVRARWEDGLRHAEEWHQANGQLADCTEATCSPDGYNLGRWLKTQRARARGVGRELDDTEIKALDALGMRWSE